MKKSIIVDNETEKNIVLDTTDGNDVCKKKKVKKIIAILVACVLVLAILCTFFYFLFFRKKGYEIALENYLGCVNCERDARIEDCVPDEFWDYISDKASYEIKDDIIDAFESSPGFDDESMKYHIHIIETDKIDNDELEEIAEKLEKIYNIDEKRVKKAVSVKYFLIGDNLSLDGNLLRANRKNAIAVKIGRQWYCIEENYNFLIPSWLEEYLGARYGIYYSHYCGQDSQK